MTGLAPWMRRGGSAGRSANVDSLLAVPVLGYLGAMTSEGTAETSAGLSRID